MGKIHRNVAIPRLEAIKCTCIDCQCKPRVQQDKPNVDLYQSHFLKNKEPTQYDTTTRSNFTQHGVAPPAYTRGHPKSILSIGHGEGTFDTTHKEQYTKKQAERPELTKMGDNIKLWGSDKDEFSTTVRDNFKKPEKEFTITLGKTDGPVQSSNLASQAHFNVGNDNTNYVTTQKNIFVEHQTDRANIVKPKDSNLWDVSDDDTYNTVTRNIYTPHAAHRHLVDKSKHPAEQCNIKQGHEQLDYGSVTANSYKYTGMPSPKRAENHLHKTAIWRNNSTSEFDTTNRKSFQQVTVHEIADITERQRKNANSSITLGSDEPTMLSETKKNFIRSDMKKETVHKPDLQKTNIYIKDDPTDFTSLNRADFKKHNVKAFSPKQQDRGHHFAFGSDEPELTTITREAYLSPPPSALQISQPEIIYKSNIPIASSTSAFQQQQDNSFLTSQKQDFTRHHLEKLPKTQAPPSTSVILGTANNQYATSYTGDYQKNCCCPAIDNCCGGYHDSPMNSPNKKQVYSGHKHKISPPTSARKSECCC